MPIESNSLSRHQLRVLAILALINFVNFADRLVVPPLFPLLRDVFSVTDAQLGSLQKWLLVVLALATIPCSLLADRWSRKWIISFGVIFWSLATFFSGLAASFTVLLVARALVGVGEAAYAPAAQSMISGTFSAQARARAQAVFAAGMLLGGAAGQALGGIIGAAHGWQHAFFVVGIPGLLLGLAALRLEEPPRGPRAEVVPFWRLLGVPAYLALILSGVFITFAAISFITWGPDYVVNYKDFSLREAGVSLATVALVSLVLGVLTGGYVADRLQKRFVYGRVVAIAAAFLAAAPFILWAIEAEEKSAVLTAFFMAGFFMSWYHGPVTAVIHDLMPPRAHATSVGVYIFVTQLAGAFGPQLVGQISDRKDLEVGLQVAVAVMLAGALSLLLVIFFIRRDGLHHPRLDAFRASADD